MTDNVVRMPAPCRTKLDAKTAQACTELLAQTIWLLDQQIERAEVLLGRDPTCVILRAIGAHVETELDARLQSQSGRS